MIYNIVNPTIPHRKNPEGITEPKQAEEKTEGSSQDEESGDPKFEKNLISGIISLILLAITERSEEPLYGYRIWKEMEARENGKVSLKQGTIYPVLRSLKKEGLLESEIRASESGPARKYYWITAKGRGTLETWKESWCNTRDFVDKILGGEPHE
ncbi:MAG: PadR family transcriptional regulator [Theionarchaea archaeon]|nr:PadR family transcriptional regulator [Theionarchaea archaeon]